VLYVPQFGNVSCPVTFLLVRRFLDLLRLGPSPGEKDVEIAVLRNQRFRSFVEADLAPA
jgi:hypothetical protein